MSFIEQTETLDYFQAINLNTTQIDIIIDLLEGTIFSLLKTHPEVFRFNEYYIIKDGICQFIFQNGQMIGKGAYGYVYKTINPNNNQPAALKVQENCKFEEVIYLADEFNIQKKIEKHYPECIIQIQNKIFINQKENHSYQIYAYLDLGLGNLREYQNKLKKFTNQQFDNLFDNILDGIIKIHSLKIAHGDIKLDNIINTKKKGWVLADFGSAIQYETSFGNYPIVGTKAYMQKQIRNALDKNLKVFKMNLFKKDIYAFQLALLQILYPDNKISHLQQILDYQKLVHPKIDSLYNKDYHTIKCQFQQIKFTRIPLFEESIIETKALISDDKLIYLSKYSKLPYSHNKMYCLQQAFKCVLEGHSEEHIENNTQLSPVKRMLFLKKSSKNYSPDISCQEIFEQISFKELTKADYDVYYDIFEKKGQKSFQLMLCQRYQEVQKELNCNLQLQEAELFYIFDDWNQAKQIINSINILSKFENHELLLKFLCLKSRLNNQWTLKRQEIIPYFKNYRGPFYLLNEWKFILMDSMWMNKQLFDLNFIYFNKEDLQEFKKNLKQFYDYYFIRCRDSCYKSQSIDSSCLEKYSIINNMRKMNYDNYTIFYWCWERCIIQNYQDSYQVLIQEFINFIEQNMQNYYFNWIIYDLYAQFLIYKKQYKLAKNYLQKAYLIIQNDCIYNQFTVQLHIFQLQFLEDHLEYFRTYSKIINLLIQMPDSEAVLILYKSIYQGLDTKPDLFKRILSLTDYVERQLQSKHQNSKIQNIMYLQKQKFQSLQSFGYAIAKEVVLEPLHDLFIVDDFPKEDDYCLKLKLFLKTGDKKGKDKNAYRLLSIQAQQFRISYYLNFDTNIQQFIDPTLLIWDYQFPFKKQRNFVEFFKLNKSWLGNIFYLLQ